MSEVCKKMYPRETVDELIKFYGDPRGRNGKESPKWFAANLVRWMPPYPMYYSDGKRTPFTKGLWVHKKCLGSFNDAFAEVLKEFGHQKIEELRLNISGGVFSYRVQRNGTRLSIHSWACAIDMDPARNPFPAKWKPNKGMLDLDFVAILEKHGFWWRGRDGDTDPMHLQCAWR